jgi:uncharacterized protein DUF2510
MEAGMNLSPEQMIRRYLDEHGGETDATVRHLLTTFGIDDADQDGRDRIRRALFAVGVGMDRQLPFLHPDERIHLSVADRPSTHTAPTPLGTAATGDQAQTGESQVKGGPAQQHPAGWYADPSGGRQRYWDGTRWTEHYAAGPQPQMKASKSASLTEQPRAFWLAAAGAALMIIGGLGPWATAFGTLDISGTKGDGWIVVGAGALGLVALWFFFAGQRRLALAVLAGLCGLAGAGTAIYDLVKLSGAGSEEFFGEDVDLVDPAWGIYAAAAGSCALSVAAAKLAFDHRHTSSDRRSRSG